MQPRLYITGNGKPSAQRITQQHNQKPRIYAGGNGIDFVPCRICGKRLRLINGTHLSSHGTDRETYMLEYRLTPDKLCSKSFRVNHSSRSDYLPYGKREWIAAIRIVYQRDHQVFAGYLQDHYPHLYGLGSWLFGDWDSALRAAGFTPENMRLWAYWDEERVISEIQFLRKKSIPLYPAYVLRHHQKLFSAARRIFGSWWDALIAAYIEVPDNPHDGRRGGVRALREALTLHSENDLPEKLKLHAAYYFGSLRKAKAALKTDCILSAGWSKAKIVAEIIHMHKSGKPLGYAAARRANTRLVSAAEAYFGTWGNALYAAGFDPNLYFSRRWQKGKTKAKRDHTRYGNLLSPSVS